MYAKVRVTVAAALMLFLIVTWTRRCLDHPEPPRLVGADVTSDGSAARIRVDPGREVEPESRARLAVHATVVPAGSDLEWQAELYLEPTPDRARERIASETRRGDASITWDVPRDRVAVHVHAEGAVGGVWREVTTTDPDVAPIEVEFHVMARAEGTVRGPNGEPLAGARVVFVPAERDMRSEPDPFHERNWMSRPPLDAETDLGGHYAVDGIDPRAAYHGAAAAPGCAVGREYGVAFQPGALTRQDFSLGVASVVTGRLLESTGLPLANAELTLATGRRLSAAGIAWDAEGQAVSGEDGGFRFDSLSAGDKSLQTIVGGVPGSLTVGHWECRLEVGEARDLGDLQISASVFEARFSSPDGSLPSSLRVRLAFFADRPGDDEAAVLVVPVQLDDDGIVRVHGLAAGRVLVTAPPGRSEGDRWRPRTDWETYFDGTSATIDWTLAPQRDAPPAPVDARGRGIATLSLQTPPNDADTLALVFVNDSLEALSRGSGARLDVGAGIGDRVRVVLTDGVGWGVKEYDVQADVTEDLAIVADRIGNTLEIVVVDGERAVPGATVLIGPGDAGEFGLTTYKETGRDGTIVLRGVPPEIPLCVSATVFRDRPPVQNVEWVAGRARIVVDVGDR